MQRTWIKSIGKRGLRIKAQLDALKQEYFQEVGEMYEDKRIAPCQKCGSYEDSLDFHHKVKRSVGGKHTRENGLFLCRKCHQEIHGRTF